MSGSNEARRSAWRHFPLAIAGAMLIMVAVDGGLAVTAVRTFPGTVATDVFNHSNLYDAVLASAEKEAALGWTADSSVLSDGTPVIDLKGKNGQPLQGLSIAATAERPLGEARKMQLAFRESAPGRYVGETKLDLLGQWDIKLVATAGQNSLHTTRRVLYR